MSRSSNRSGLGALCFLGCHAVLTEEGEKVDTGPGTMGFRMMGLGRERSGGEMRPNSWKSINRNLVMMIA